MKSNNEKADFVENMNLNPPAPPVNALEISLDSLAVQKLQFVFRLHCFLFGRAARWRSV